MASSHHDDDLLLIRCPSCGQRFNVEEDLRGRMVECGECDHQFEIHDSVILRGKKFYPGEKRDPFLDQISRVDKPLPTINDPGVPDFYASQTNPEVIEPVSPQRIVMGSLAFFAVAVTGLLLVLGAKRGAALDGVSTEQRMLVAGFISILATGLLVYANARTWLLMLLIGLVMGGGLVSLPLFFTGGSTTLAEIAVDDEDPESRNSKNPAQQEAPDSSKMSLTELRELIGTDPLDEERARLIEGGSTKTALGLWLRNLKVRNCLLVRDYVIREMKASFETHFYPRGRDEFLMVVTGIESDLDSLAMIAAALGKVKNLHQELGIVEVVVDNERFVSGPIERLTNPQDPQFYLLNKTELESIELDRIKSAVKRLAEAEPVLFRNDISKRMVELLESDWIDNKDDVCRALLKWATQDSGAGRVALQQAASLRAMKKEIPVEMIALCVQQRKLDVLPLLYELWQENPARWEPWFREIGPPSERIHLLGFERTSGSLRQSSCRILGYVGGETSLPVLKVALSTTSDAETRIIAKTAIQLIEKRIGKGTRPQEEIPEAEGEDGGTSTTDSADG